MSLSETIVFYIFAVLFIVYVYAQYRLMKKEKYPRYNVLPVVVESNQDNHQNSHQQEDIFNISSRVQGQEQWPTHDAHLSIDHINIMNELNKPPSYQDDAPPSYEEAMRLAAAKQQGESSSVAVIVVAPKPSTTN